jgi:hypothetical protein
LIIFEREFAFTVTEAAVGGVGYPLARYHIPMPVKAPRGAPQHTKQSARY